MPQMSPLNWMTLMIMFIITFIMIMILNYYISQYSLFSKQSTLSNNKNLLNWKW